MTTATTPHRLSEEQAGIVQPGDVLYLRENAHHYVVGQVRPAGIAAPLFYLEAIGVAEPRRQRDYTDRAPDLDPGWTSWRLCGPPRDGCPSRAPYRGGYRRSVRTLRTRGEPTHPTPDDPERPDEARLLTTAQAATRLGIDPSRVRRFIEAGRLPATLYGKTWLIREVDLALVAVRKPGRPRRQGC